MISSCDELAIGGSDVSEGGDSEYHGDNGSSDQQRLGWQWETVTRLPAAEIDCSGDWRRM